MLACQQADHSKLSSRADVSIPWSSAAAPVSLGPDFTLGPDLPLAHHADARVRTVVLTGDGFDTRHATQHNARACWKRSLRHCGTPVGYDTIATGAIWRHETNRPILVSAPCSRLRDLRTRALLASCVFSSFRARIGPNFFPGNAFVGVGRRTSERWA